MQGRQVGGLAVGVACLVSVEDADTASVIEVEAAGGYGAVAKEQVVVDGLLEVQVAPASSLEALGYDCTHLGEGDAECLETILHRWQGWLSC